MGLSASRPPSLRTCLTPPSPATSPTPPSCGEFTLTALIALLRRRLPAQATREQDVRHDEVRRLANALRELHDQRRTNRGAILELVDEMAPGLTDRVGVGPISAVQVLVSYSHPGRCRNESAFASLTGTNPGPASSGNTNRRRLNRGGDRQLTAPCTPSP